MILEGSHFHLPKIHVNKLLKMIQSNIFLKLENNQFLQKKIDNLFRLIMNKIDHLY